MEYISLLNLKNKYPSTNNYIKEAAGNVKLEGLYISDPKYYELYIKNDGKVDSAEYKVNFIKFDKPIVKLDEVVTVPKTSFNFVLAIKTTAGDTVPKYFTSEQYYKKLQESAKDGNPYFINRALDKRFIIQYNLEETVKLIKDLEKNEKDVKVTLGNHIYIKGDKSIDYNVLVQYIDWLVSPVKPDDSLNGGVIKPEVLINYDFKVEKLKLEKLPDSVQPSTGNSGPTNRYATSTPDRITYTPPAEGAPPPMPSGTDSSIEGSGNYYYNVKNESGADALVTWRKRNVPDEFRTTYKPGQDGVICAQEGTIIGNVTRVQVAGCGS